LIIKRKIIISLLISIFIILCTNNIYSSTLSFDISSLDDEKYPGIKSLIQNLQSDHPSWKFQVEYTGLDFNDVIMNECQGHGASPRNLSPANNGSYSGMWICPICGTRLYDSGNWYCASEESIKYMIDPRNSLNDSDVFQFLDLSYVESSNVSTSEVNIKMNGDLVEIIPNIDFNGIKSKYSNSRILNKYDQEITEGNVGTGDKIQIDGNTYIIIKKGDVNGDGNVNIVDVVNMLNHITGTIQLDNFGINAGKIKSSENISIVDVVIVLNNITGKESITFGYSENSNSNNSLNSGVYQMAQSIPYLDEECIKTIISVSNEFKINPLYLMARIYQEQGRGTSPLANGEGYNGEYIGVYNLYNINASGNSKEKVIKNGLAYASSKGWTSKSKAIRGGAEIIANSYISKNQDTLYYQKFNVVGTTQLYTHQYMQNILAAQTEGSTLRKTYKSIDEYLQNTYVFTIPIYENMPRTACTRPNTQIANIGECVEKTVSVSSSLKVRSAATVNSSVITSLKNGDRVKIIRTTPEVIDGYYWSLVVCESTGAYGYVAADYLK